MYSQILILAVLSTVAVSQDITVKVRIVAPDLDFTPPAVIVSVPIGSTVLDAMELAAGENTLYRFGGTNFGPLGWLIQTYGGISNDLQANTCWFFYVKHRGGNGFRPNKGVSTYLLTVEETIVTFRYELDTELCREF